MLMPMTIARLPRQAVVARSGSARATLLLKPAADRPRRRSHDSGEVCAACVLREAR